MLKIKASFPLIQIYKLLIYHEIFKKLDSVIDLELIGLG